MNCVRCDYYLWSLPENRCPECGCHFEVTDYAFVPSAVHFVCRYCEQTYLGNDDRGLPYPRRFNCVKCTQPLDAAEMLVRPLSDESHGQPLWFGTPWEQRQRVGLVRAFVDGIARLAIQPGENFRLSSVGQNQGATAFSVACAYVAALLFLAVILLFQSGGLAGWMPDMRRMIRFPYGLLALAAIPLIQIVWNYFYGMSIQAVLWSLGQTGTDFEQSVRAVAFGSAVLPAVLLLPPIGLVWYVVVVTSGIEHLHATTRRRAFVATLIPMLLAANIVLGVTYAIF
jgi:hypothetical protein